MSVATGFQREEISRTMDTICYEEIVNEIAKSEGSKNGHGSGDLTCLNH